MKDSKNKGNDLFSFLTAMAAIGAAALANSNANSETADNDCGEKISNDSDNNCKGSCEYCKENEKKLDFETIKKEYRSTKTYFEMYCNGKLVNFPFSVRMAYNHFLMLGKALGIED